MIVIHPKDKTTEFLKKIYSGKNHIKLIDETWNNRRIRETIGTADKNEIVMMLGHGCVQGLFAPFNNQQFGRLIIDNRIVYLLREHPCVGIWCYANEFAKKYELKGLFSGMVVSSKDEADMNGLDVEGESIYDLNNQYASDLSYCFDHYSLDLIPLMMEEIQDYHSDVKDFNYKSLFYY